MNKKVSIIYFAYDPKLFLKKRILNKMFVDKNVSVKQGHKRDLQISSNTLDLRIVFTPDNWDGNWHCGYRADFVFVDNFIMTHFPLARESLMPCAISGFLVI